MSDAARSIPHPTPAPSASTAPPTLVVVANRAEPSDGDVTSRLAEELARALGDGAAADLVRVRFDAQPDQVTILLDADGEADLFALNAIAASHGAALAAVTRQGEVTSVAVLVARQRGGGAP